MTGNHIMLTNLSGYESAVDSIDRFCRKERETAQPQFTLDDGSSVYRPLTFKETTRAQVECYNTLKNPDGSNRSLDDRLRLFKRGLDSCTGIAYKAGTTLFKVIPQCKELIRIKEYYAGSAMYLTVNYDALQGVELNSSTGRCNSSTGGDDTSLPFSSITDNNAWLAAVEEDKVLLHELVEIISSSLSQPPLNQREAMEFRVMSERQVRESTRDQMTYLAVSSLNDGFYADGTISPLPGPNRFLMAVSDSSREDITWGTRNW